MNETEQTPLPIPAQAQRNGFHPDMDESDLLAELSAETIGPSYGYVRLKVTKGDKVKHVRLKVQPIDVLRLTGDLDVMPKKTKEQVLSETRRAMSVGFTDENWLQALAAFVYGLASPHTLKLGSETVWIPDGKPQDLPKAMIAVVKAGFDFWHVNDVSNAVTRLTRDVLDEDFGPNSSAPSESPIQS